MAIKFVNRLSTALVFKEVNNELTLTYHITATRLIKLKSTESESIMFWQG